MKRYFKCKEDNICYAYDDEQGPFIAKSDDELFYNKGYNYLYDLEPSFETQKSIKNNQIYFVGIKYNFKLLACGLDIQKEIICELSSECFSIENKHKNERFLKSFIWKVAFYLNIDDKKRDELYDSDYEEAIIFLWNHLNK